MGMESSAPASRALALLWGGAAAASLALVPWAPEAAAWAPPCLFRSLTGLPCPTCGATRAVLALSRLRLAEAAAHNPLVTAAALAFLLGGLAAGIAALAGRPPREPRAFGLRTRLAAFATIGANWAWVLVHGG